MNGASTERGEHAHTVRIAADVSQGGAKALDRDELGKLHELIWDFLYWEPIVPGTAEGLARFLAPLARFLRDDVREALSRGVEPIQKLAAEWRNLLFPEGDDAQFADAYAQTVTYALLLARFEGASSLSPLSAVQETPTAACPACRSPTAPGSANGSVGTANAHRAS